MPTCPSCQQENPDGARFCNACGAGLRDTPAEDVLSSFRRFMPEGLAEARRYRPLVGREQEMGELRTLAASLAEGRGGLLCIEGEAGGCRFFQPSGRKKYGNAITSEERQAS